MERRLYLVLGVLGALAGLALILALYLKQPPRVRPPVVPQPPPSVAQPPSVLPHAEREAGTLKGRVVNGKTGAPIAGAKVAALTPHLEPAKTKDEVPLWGGLLERKSVQSDENGQFAIRELPPDYWNLWVEKRGFAWTTVPRADFEEEHEIQLFPACSVKGQVVYPDGFPAAGVRIEYHVQGTHSEVFSRYKLESYYARTKEDGTFLYEELPPGKFTIEVYPTDHLPAPWRFEPALEPGENRDLGIHKLDDGFGLTVHVVWRETNEPVPDVEVVVRPVADPMPRTNIGQRRRTDAKGIARFKGLGGQVITNPKMLVAANLGSGPVLADEGGMHAPGSDVTIRLRKEGIVKGTVLGPDGEPVDQFYVDLEAVGHITQQLRESGSNGAFKVYQVPGGSYTLHVRSSDFVDAERKIDVAEGKELDVGAIRLERGVQIAGVVRRSNGAALKGAVRVSLARKTKNRDGEDVWEEVQRGLVRQDGGYVLRGVAPGRYGIWPQSLRNPSGSSGPVEIDVPEGVAALQQDLVFWGDGFLNLRFVDLIDGNMREVVQPPTYLVETATGREVRWWGAATRLRPGTYTLHVELPDAQGVPRRYKVQEVQVVETEVPAETADTDPTEVRLFEIRDGK